MSDTLYSGLPGQKYAVDSLRDISPRALGEIRSFLESSGFALPISQVIGFQQFTAQYATVSTSEAITSATYADIATAGPTITNLPAGSYVLLYGAYLEGQPSSNTVAYAAPSVNGSTPSDSAAATQQALYQVSVSSASLATMTAQSNTVKLQYRRATSGPYDPSATYRWMIALRYANA
jgi:hypothetical protein